MATISSDTKTLTDARNSVLNIINETPNAVFSYGKVDSLLFQGIRNVLRNASDFNTVATIQIAQGANGLQLADPVIHHGEVTVYDVRFNGEALEAAKYEPPSSSGTPSKYAIHGDNVYLYPTTSASGTLTVSYLKEFTEPRNSDDEMGVPDTYLDVAVLYAAYMLKVMDEEYTSAGMLRNAYQDALNAATALKTGVYSASEEYNYS